MQVIIEAAIRKYVDSKGGYEFYRQRVDAAKTHVSSDGYVHLLRSGSKEILASYSLDELGLSADLVNSEVVPPSTEKTASTHFALNADPQRVIGIASSAIVAAGCFSPLVTLPVVGSINYLYNGRGDGVVVLIASFICLGLSIAGLTRLLPKIGSIVLLLVFTSLWLFQIRITAAREALQSDLEGNPFLGLANAALGSIGLGWAWLFLISGAIGLLVAGHIDVIDGKASLPEYCILPRGGRLSHNIGINVIVNCGVGLALASVVHMISPLVADSRFTINLG
jgi:hypothetical protein